MKVLITGGAGFIGSTLAREFKRPDEVFVFDNYAYSGFEQHIDEVPGLCIYNGDLADIRHVRACFRYYRGFDLVIHAAAESAVDKSIKHYEPFIETNILGAANLFKMCLEYNVPKIINFGTDEIFGQLQAGDKPFDENTPMKPRNIYSASKAAQVMFANAFKETHNLPVLNVCPSNCYGPRQLPEKLLPRMIYLLSKGKELPVYGTGQNIREWLFVEDAARAIRVLAEKGEIGETYTVGSDNEKTNVEILQMLGEVMGVEPKFNFIQDRKGHDFRYSVNCDKIKALGWKTDGALKENLKKTVDWYLEPKNYAWLEENYKKIWSE